MKVKNITTTEIDNFDNLKKPSYKAYLAGKITGCKEFKSNFEYYRKYLEELDYTVLDPSILPANMTREDYMKICFAMIDVSDIVYFQPNWTLSDGAKVEMKYCKYIHKPIRFLN